jgi:hypothetical protein
VHRQVVLYPQRSNFASVYVQMVSKEGRMIDRKLIKFKYRVAIFGPQPGYPMRAPPPLDVCVCVGGGVVCVCGCVCVCVCVCS